MANTPPPVPTRSVMTDSTGLATRPWIAWFTTLGQLFGFNQVVQADGVAQPTEVAINFLSAFTVTDNPTNGSTDIGIAASEPPYQTGTAVVGSTGNDYATLAVAFSTPFSGNPKVFVNPTNFPRTGNVPMTCYATDISPTGFIINLACAVPTGGGGDTIDNNVTVDWIALP